MMITISSYFRRVGRLLRRLTRQTRLRLPARIAMSFLSGFCLSAASLRHQAQPLVLGVLCSGPGGWMSVPAALGAAAGYRLFWAQAGLQGIVWTAAGLAMSAALGQRRFIRQFPALMPALTALATAVTGLLFQAWFRDITDLGMYLLRIGVAFGSTWLLSRARQGDAVARWGAAAVAVLALAQLAPLPVLDLGVVAAGAISVLLPFPAVVLAGLALDLAQISRVPMAAVLCLAFLLRLIPGIPKWSVAAAPAVAFLLVMGLCETWELQHLGALALGSVAGLLLPGRAAPIPRRGPTGVAQVRLEMAAQVLSQSEQLLREVPEPPLDEQALIVKAAERACGTCPCRRECDQTEQARCLPSQLLHRPLLTVEDLNLRCKKRGRLLVELRRCQDQYRMLRADRDRRREYHSALLQQYRFLTEYLQDLADLLPRRAEQEKQRFEPEIAVCSAGRESQNGDRCGWFAGPQLQYYLLLCDGMGTGEAAAREAVRCVDMLRRLLTAGYPAEYALRGINSLCALRGMPGAVSIDLAKIDLSSGKTMIYKWGAAPSWLLLPAGAEQVGTAGTPPGLDVTHARETVERLSLRRGETLVLLSDGVAGEEALATVQHLGALSPGELAAAILEAGRGNGADDATAAVIRLHPVTTSAS